MHISEEVPVEVVIKGVKSSPFIFANYRIVKKSLPGSLSLLLSNRSHLTDIFSILKVRIQALQLRCKRLPDPFHVRLPFVVVCRSLGIGERLAQFASDLENTIGCFLCLFELMLFVGTGGSVKLLDGLELRPALEEGSDMDVAWSKLEKLGVLKKKAITS